MTKHLLKIETILIAVGILFGYFDQRNEIFAQAGRPNQQTTQQRAPIRFPSSNRKPSGSNAQSSQQRNRVPSPTPLPSQRLAAQKPASPNQNAPTSCLLQSTRQIGQSDIIEVVLEGSGNLLQTSSTEVMNEKIEVVAGFRYEERLERYSKQPGGALRSIRQYEQAGMRRKIGNSVTKPLLDSSRKNLICDFDGKKTSIYSPMGPLKNDQFLLVDELPANSLLLDQLLPNRSVKLGDEWGVSNDILAAILGLEAVQNNTMRLVLTAIIDDIAEVDIFLESGTDEKGEQLPSSIEGAYLGASVLIDLEGKYQFDLKTKRMTWFGLLFNERRSESLVEPGLDWTASVKIKIAPLQQPTKLTDETVGSLRKESEPDLLKLFYNGQNGPWQFYHSRNWRMIEDGAKTAALCLVVQGEGVAQCNILSNGKIDLQSMPSLDAYKKEIQKGLGDHFGQFVREAEYVNDAGYNVYSVIVDGQYEENPFRWIYYLLTDDYGNQTTLMFEIRADMLDVFDTAGQEILESFRMIVSMDSADNIGIDAEINN